MDEIMNLFTLGLKASVVINGIVVGVYLVYRLQRAVRWVGEMTYFFSCGVCYKVATWYVVKFNVGGGEKHLSVLSIMRGDYNEQRILNSLNVTGAQAYPDERYKFDWYDDNYGKRRVIKWKRVKL